MILCWHVVVAVVLILIKENLCVPAILPLSKGAIIFPEDNWDDCFLDEASTQSGVCKRVAECPEILKEWNKQSIYPKTCYFIKTEQFVCCPIATSKEATTSTKKPKMETTEPFNIFHDIFNTDPGLFTKKPLNIDTLTPTNRPSNIFLDNLTTNSETTTKRPTNVFLDNLTTNSGTTTKRPTNVFLDNLNIDKTTTKQPLMIIPDIFNTAKPLNLNRRSDIECNLQNQENFKVDVNGGESSNTNEFPFMAALGFKSNSANKIWYPCGGVLVSSRYVLTAAHCAEIGGGKPSVVHLGGTNLTESEEGTIKIKQFITYPGYNVSTIYNDIALLELEEEVNNPTACLWSSPDVPITKLTALGYGHTRFGGLGSNELLKSPLTVIDNNQCQQFYKLDDNLQTMDIVDGHLCAGDIEHFRDTCQRDSGGPLIMELDKVSYVMGITSYGLGCAGLPPSIYTRVSSFIDWIETHIWPEIDVRFD